MQRRIQLDMFRAERKTVPMAHEGSPSFPWGTVNWTAEIVVEEFRANFETVVVRGARTVVSILA